MVSRLGIADNTGQAATRHYSQFTSTLIVYGAHVGHMFRGVMTAADADRAARLIRDQSSALAAHGGHVIHVFPGLVTAADAGGAATR